MLLQVAYASFMSTNSNRGIRGNTSQQQRQIMAAREHRDSNNI